MIINIMLCYCFYHEGEFTDKHVKTAFNYKLIVNQVFMTYF